MKVVNKLYVRKLLQLTYWEKVLYLIMTEYATPWDKIFTGYNPLYWCLRDLYMLVLAFTWMVIRPFIALFTAVNFAEQYADDEYYGVFQCDTLVPDCLYEILRDD